MEILKIIANPDKMMVLNRAVRAAPVLLKVSDNVNQIIHRILRE